MRTIHTIRCKVHHIYFENTTFTQAVKYDETDWQAWKNGMLIQNAFPYLNAGEREMIKTGICGACWDRMLG